MSHGESSSWNENDRRIRTPLNSSSEHCSIDHRSPVESTNHIFIKDVILHRTNPHERLGLTLSYGLTSNLQTNIYIEEVEKNSIAHRQGKLQRGDQIIQINDHPITNRDQAIQLIQQFSTVIFQIIPQKFVQRNLSTVESTFTEDDSGIILAFNTDFEKFDQNWTNGKTSLSLCSSEANDHFNISEDHWHFLPIESRRSFSCNDLTNLSFPEEEIFFCQSSMKHSIHDQTSFELPTDNERRILKPLPLNTSKYQFKQQNSLPTKSNRRPSRRRRQTSKTTDQQKLSPHQQEKCSRKEQRKKLFRRSKRYDKRVSSLPEIL